MVVRYILWIYVPVLRSVTVEEALRKLARHSWGGGGRSGGAASTGSLHRSPCAVSSSEEEEVEIALHDSEILGGGGAIGSVRGLMERVRGEVGGRDRKRGGGDEIGRRRRDESAEYSYDRRKRSREETNNGRTGGSVLERSDREVSRRTSGDSRRISRSRSRSRERERRGRSEDDYDEYSDRDGKRRRYHREFGTHGNGRERLWIGSSRDCAERRSRALPCRDRGRERERPRAGEKEKEKEVVTEEKEGEEKARTYQLEVLAQAKVKNTIAFLETGAGKTLIAVLLMKEKHKFLREQGKRMLAVFLVPKVPLVYQQAEVIRTSTKFTVGHYCGEMGQDFWDARRWQREFDTKDVFVMTAQILLNILRHSIVKMESIHLLVLDECHHAVKKHPYSLVMSEFYHISSKDKRPCVFGMTASPVNLKGVSNQEDCAIKIRNLESKLDSIVCTIKDREELEKYVPMPSETMVVYDKPALFLSLRDEIKQMEATVEEAANASAKRSKWRFMGARDAGAKEELRLVYGVAERTESDGAASLAQKLRAVIYALDELGPWCAYKVSLNYLTTLRNDERIQNHQLDVKFQEKYLEKVCGLLRCELREGAVGSKDAAENGESADVESDKVQDPMDVEEGELPDSQVVSVGEHVDEILGAAVADGKVTPKVQSLVKILLRYQHTDDFRAIIFVERVVAAQILPKVFAELPSLKFVKCACLIGHNNNPDMRTRHMQQTISRFRDGRVTLLVATSVAEEGLDIRQCNVVIRFDLAKTVLAYIQSRGRARKPGSDYILMLERANLQHEAFLRNAKNSEETLRKEAIERTDLGEKRESAILASIDVGEGEIYQVPATGAVVSMNSAVGLVHFYCSQLPSDRYSILRPEFIMSKHEGQGGVRYSCKLQLPCNAPLETVEGPECSSIRAAQQVVCLDACKKLHEMGAFTDMLLPDKGNGEEAQKLEGSDEGEPLPGTSRHREYYPEGIADILKGDWIVADKDADAKLGGKVLVFMYKVKCENIGFSKDTLLTETSDFAILVGQELQQEVLTMAMDLFVARTMTTRASLEFCGALDLSLPQLTELKSFHVRLMSIVLDVNVEPASTPWDPVKAYLFVPVVHNVSSNPIESVDWDLVKMTIETDAWNNPLQRARPDVYLGTDERALGGDRREYGFGKLRCGLAFGLKAHPTYGIRGAVAQFDVVKATGLLPAQDTVEKTVIQEVPPEGKLLLADGFIEVEGLVGRIVTAVHSGKRFYVDAVRIDMTADSSFPQKDGYLGPLEYTSYADYYKQKYGVELVCKKQPLLRGRGVSHCKNLLSPRFETSDGPANSQDALDKTYYVMLPPELCFVHPLPGPLVRGAQRLPSVMRRVESMLLAIQLKHRIDYPIAASKVLEALTAASCQETFSYERAELLGDAYLKWVVSRRLFLKFPTKHEGQLTRMRQQIVSNSVLYQYALEKGLQGYIQADRFAPSRWAAPGVPPVFDEDTKDGDDLDKETKPAGAGEVVEVVGEEGEIVVTEINDDLSNMEDGEIEGDTNAYRVLSSKTLADVVEAFIGIYYVEGGQDAATHLMNWIGIPVDFDEADGQLAISGCQVPEAVLRSIDFPALEASIGHKFRERSLLVEGITHASRPSSGVPCYQRLEFVGDAVLDHLITRYLFFKYTDLPPGRLTDLRAAAVNNENFARVAVKHSFHRHLRHGSSALETQIRNFVNDIQTELDKPGVNSFGLGDFKAPKVLGDILESIAGALFLDTCLDSDQVWKVFEPLVQPMVTPETLPMHPVRELQERCQQQAEGLEYKASRAGNVATVEVYIDGVQIGSAQNAQKKMAQKLAARNALVILKENEVLKEKDAETENGDGNAGKANKNGSPNFTRQTLNDLCLKRQWPMPQYRSVLEGGPAHAKRFTYSVRVLTTTNGWTEECFGEPMPSVKKAKDSAALILLALLKRS